MPDVIHLVTDPAEIDAAFGPHEAKGWSGALVLEKGCRVWGFDGGAFIVSPQDDGSMQVHSALLPNVDYKHAVECARLAILQEQTAGNVLVGRTPKPNRRALHFAIAAGMKYVSENEKEWITWA